MMLRLKAKALDFYTYPPIGGDDWRYGYAAARVRALQTQMIPKSTLVDMANAGTFEQAAESISTTEYIPVASKTLAELEQVLIAQRRSLREQFARLMIDNSIVKLFKTRDDFANMRLAVRRRVTDKAIGTDYSSQGNLNPEIFEEVFEQEKYELLGEHIQNAVEQAILAYYTDRDICRIDHIIDRAQAEYNIQTALKMKSEFLTGLFSIKIDLTNIITMLRLKFTESEKRKVFLPGGYIEIERLKQAVDTEYDSIGQLFYATPYYRIVSVGANYVGTEKSFLKAEQASENHLSGYLNTTSQITSGPQPVIAYLLQKEKEIRTVRLILTAKKNLLDKKMILDRIGE